MGRLKTGAFLSSFKLDFASALRKASDIGLDGLQFSSIENEIDIESISDGQAREIIDKFADHGLVISAVCGDIGGFHVDDERTAKDRVERTKRIMDTTKKLGSDIVQTHIGFIPEDFSDDKVRIMRESLEEIGRYGENTRVYLATETGPEPAERMKRFLDTIAVPTVKVNYDPANLAMKGFDYLGGVQELKDYIIHTHAKDGRSVADEFGRKEQPLGQGDVDWPKYVAALDEIGYNGFYTIEREAGDTPVEDIVEAKRFLDKL